ncbi:hypothetical protein D3C84_1129390 [compost metagenome]
MNNTGVPVVDPTGSVDRENGAQTRRGIAGDEERQGQANFRRSGNDDGLQHRPAHRKEHGKQAERCGYKRSRERYTLGQVLGKKRNQPSK